MKINKSGITYALMSKHSTKLGHIYTTTDRRDVYFRCQGGFVNMESGEYTNFPDVTDAVQWVPLPDAILHVNGQS